MLIGYLRLIGVVISETIAIIAMDLTQGFSQNKFLYIGITAYALTFVFLTMALKTIPAGIANAVWAGASTILVAIVANFLLHESLHPIQWVWLLIITIGLIGLNLS